MVKNATPTAIASNAPMETNHSPMIACLGFFYGCYS
jgi:hypothetical protein